MVVDTLKNILPKSGKHPARFRRFLSSVTIIEESREATTALLWQAYKLAEEAHAHQKRESGKPYFEHCYEVGLLLSEWNMDATTIAAGLLHDTLEDTSCTPQMIENQFGTEILHLVEGVTKLKDIRFQSREEQQAENYMKMLLSVAKDIRVIIIKFADRLHNMRTIHHLPNIKQRRIAIETRDVYAPLAHRLGMARVKWELEDLALQALEPETFSKLVKQVQDSRSEREKYIAEFVKPIQKKLDDYGVNAKVSGRPKHYYSVWGKMQRRRVNFEEIYDLLAIRIITSKVDEVYAALGIVHQMYTPVQERFKDFIATPKINGYQSLHTTVVGPSGKVVEVQFRTEEMDRTAESGVAAHWRYKENEGSDSAPIDRQVRWLRELVEIAQSDRSSPEEFLELLKFDLFKDEIFVFTPKGDLKQLPLGSTPVDMAFDIHTQVGLHCVGARVNGKIVPLNTRLNNSDTVEVITSEHQTPNYAWLKFVETSRAKTQIQRFMRKAQLEESIRLGKEILQKTLRRLGKMSIQKDLKKDPTLAGYENINGLYSDLGRGVVTVRQMIERVAPEAAEESGADISSVMAEPPPKRTFRSAKGVSVDGMSDLLMGLGKCCNPIPGDDIIGFVTRGRGITVHRLTCSNLAVNGVESDRYVQVDWDVDKNKTFLVQLKIIAEDRKHFLKDLTENTSKLNTNIVSVDLTVEEGILTLLMMVEVDGLRQLQRLRNRLRMVPGIIYMERT